MACEHVIIIMLGAVVVLLAAYCAYIRWRRKNDVRKVRFMLNAVSNSDFMFNFSTEYKDYKKVELNASLNRIKEVVAKAREEAVEQEKFYAIILDAVDTGIMIIDSRGNVKQRNSAALRLLSMDVLTHENQLKRISDELFNAVDAILPGDRRRVMFHGGNGAVNLSLRCTKTMLRGQEMRLITLTNINSELDENELDSWTKLIRVLTHEIMNSVTPITSMSETLLSKSTGELHDGLQVINKTSCELMSFVENYRKFTHVPTPEPKLFYLKPFVERMASLAKRQAGGEKVTFSIDVNPADLILYSDESLVSRVMTNIMKNAVQAVADGGEVGVKAFTGENDEVVIDITDNGQPISDDVAAHIFIPFFTTKKGGSGIGLSLARQIMHTLGGSITFEQNRKRGIKRFRLVFP